MSKSKAMCSGCRDDYYNHNREGGCWCFKTAKIVTRIRVGIWELPPYGKNRKEKVLSCYSPDGYAMLKLDDCRVKELKEKP